MLYVLGGRVGHSGYNIAVAALHKLGDKIVFVRQLAQHAACRLNLLNNLRKRLVTQIPVAFPRFQPVQLGGFNLFELS